MKNLLEFNINIKVECSLEFADKLQLATEEELASMVALHCFRNNVRFVTNVEITDSQIYDDSLDVDHLESSRNGVKAGNKIKAVDDDDIEIRLL